LLIAMFAAGIASWFVNNPAWLAIQRYFMGFVLSALAVRLMLEQKRMA
jgi:threonine/homoserine/homoserine lactone efflux protein